MLDRFCGRGSLAASEDLAQETFINAWRRLNELREPGKLRQWLCGIVRNLAANSVRREIRRGGAPESLEAVADEVSPEADPATQAVTHEEETLLWRALAGIPENYREPMVLFYREDQSVAEVASGLDLSEAVVRQRLSRGRTMLRAEMAAVVESALTRTRPTRAFTAGVLGALTLGPASQASAAGSAAPVAVAAAKSLLGSAGAGPILGPIGGLLTAWLSSKIVGLTARSEPERASIARSFVRAMSFTLPMIVLLLGLVYLGLRVFPTSAWFFASVTTIWTGVLLAGLFRVSAQGEREISRIRAETGTEDDAWASELAKRGLSLPGTTHRESKARFLGLPLYCYSSSWLDMGRHQSSAARAWIAIGDVAISPLLAIGGLAIAPVAFGGLSVGVISVGGAAIGLLAIGSIAAGWYAFGPLAVAWKAAAGGVAIAHDFAVGGLARAVEANTAAAADWFRAQWFTPVVGFFVGRVAIWLIVLSIVVPLGLVAHRAWRTRR